MRQTNPIILMTKFAVYENKYGEQDRKINEYFSNDYVYRKNAWTRFYAFLGCVILLGFYWGHQFFVLGLDLFSFDYLGAVKDSLLFIAAVLVVYTLIGSKIALSEYIGAMRRLNNYSVLLARLDRMRDR